MKFKIFKKPLEGERYTIGIDVAGGEIGHDESSICVLSSKLEQVAISCGVIAPDLLGEVACRVGEHYNNAILVPEVNNMGITTVYKIRDRGYPHIYKRITANDESLVSESDKLGWNTNSKTKWLMLNELATHLRSGELKLYDEALIKELSTLYKESNGNINLNGKDRTVALCLAIQGISQLPIESVVIDSRKVEIKTLEDKINYLGRRKTYESSFE